MASAFTFTSEKFARDVQQTITRLKAFDAKLGKKWLRQAANKASVAHLRILKATASEKNKDWGTGQWRKSLGRRVRLYTSRGRLVAWWAVGPRSAKVATVPRKVFIFRYRGPHDKPASGKYEQKRRTYKQPSRGFKPGKFYRIPIGEKTPEKFRSRKMWPVKYSHLIERRHHPIARANARAQGQVANAITDTLTEAMASV